MSKYVETQWHFGRLTDADKKEVRRLFAEKKLDEIKALYVKRKAAPSNMGTCAFCDDRREIHDWTTWAIQTGKI